MNNELDGSVVVNIRPRAGVSCIASLTTNSPNSLDCSPGTIDALAARVAGSTGVLLIVTTFELSGSDGVDGVEGIAGVE